MFKYYAQQLHFTFSYLLTKPDVALFRSTTGSFLSLLLIVLPFSNEFVLNTESKTSNPHTSSTSYSGKKSLSKKYLPLAVFLREGQEPK
jgi:hypothetical protein